LLSDGFAGKIDALTGMSSGMIQVEGSEADVALFGERLRDQPSECRKPSRRISREVSPGRGGCLQSAMAYSGSWGRMVRKVLARAPARRAATHV
jgi:hypothetical protein